jgi:hypothetical protein
LLVVDCNFTVRGYACPTIIYIVNNLLYLNDCEINGILVRTASTIESRFQFASSQ